MSHVCVTTSPKWLKEISFFSTAFVLLLSCINKVLSYEVDTFCDTQRLCGDRGACVEQRDVDDTKFTFKCFCVPGYDGRWCQFLDDGSERNSSIGKDVPRPPTILTGAENYEKQVRISWKRASSTLTTSVLYYSLRYKILGVRSNTSWVFVDELAIRGKRIYSTVLGNLEWGEKYLVEVYAGNRNGVGEPAMIIINRPKGVWSSWTAWSPCEHPSRGCVKRPRIRQRECNPAPLNDGKYCGGDHVDYERCPFPLCASAVKWSPWTPCFPVCGKHSRRLRHRNCKVVGLTWDGCDGKIEDVSCVVTQCPDMKIETSPKQVANESESKTNIIKKQNNTEQQIKEDKSAEQHTNDHQQSARQDLMKNTSVQHHSTFNQHVKEKNKSQDSQQMKGHKPYHEKANKLNVEEHGNERGSSDGQRKKHILHPTLGTRLILHHQKAYNHHQKAYNHHQKAYNNHQKAYNHHQKAHNHHQKAYNHHQKAYNHHQKAYNHHQEAYKSVEQKVKDNKSTKEHQDKDLSFLIFFIGSTSFLVLLFLAYIIHDRMQKKCKSKQMTTELLKMCKETRPSGIVNLENVIETPISPNVGEALHKNSSTIIQVSKNKINEQTSYILPLPHFSKKTLLQLQRKPLKGSNSDVRSQGESANGSETTSFRMESLQSTSMPGPRVIPNETQETKERMVFCGMINILIDNWMENRGLEDSTQDVTSLEKQLVKMQEARQEVMSSGSQPVRLEMEKQDVMSSGSQPVQLEREQQEVMSSGSQPVRFGRAKQDVNSQDHRRDSSQDVKLVHFVDAILTAADHGRLKHAKLMNYNPKK